MKSILMSIQPYWGFLIIAKWKGWDLEKYGLHEKTVEVRKDVPTSPNWDKKVALYFSKDKKSLARVPEEYRGDVAKLCGKVVGEFVCDCITDFWADNTGFEAEGRYPFYMPCGYAKKATCLTNKEMVEYGKGAPLYGWHISDLKIYDKPKELSEFNTICKMPKEVECEDCPYCDWNAIRYTCFARKLTRPPQSWCYVDEL